MNVVLSGVWVLAMIIVSGLMLAQTIFGTSAVQADAFRSASRVSIERARTRISVAGSSPSDQSGGTNLAVTADNNGEVTVVQATEMDILVRYTQGDGNLAIKRLSYVSCPAGDNQWCRTSLSPDSHNPALWDPGETVSLGLRVVPTIQAGSTYTVVVVAPNGISGVGSFTR